MPQVEKTAILALGAAALIAALYYIKLKKNVVSFPPGPRVSPYPEIQPICLSQPWVTFKATHSFLPEKCMGVR
ncbi:hypothetical protein B0H10DRAFT_1991683 [Mycena sp. CBHHK59/15]|nr:hypothetical protein B0H10DRAFT_1991683 [Mycena sp. CBHHK59/15]